MKFKKTSIDINEIPRGRANKTLTAGCLVLEGGAFRGLYTAGVLDYFMQHDLNFECVIGVSAGALNGLNYATGQIGRSARINLGYRYDSRYIGMKAFLDSRSIIRLDFLFQEANKREPLDRERFYKSKQRFIAVATNCETGQPEFFEKHICQDMKSAIKASATLPYIAPYQMVEGIPCLDGGCSCKIPYQWAIEQGYQKIVIVQTRQRGFRKDEFGHGFLHIMTERLYQQYPALADALARSNRDYNQALARIEALSDRAELFAITPSQTVEVSRLERSLQKLKLLYELGLADAAQQWQALNNYLNN